MYTQDFDPVSNALGLSSIFAVLPVLALFILLGGLRLAAQWAALIALGVAMLVAMIVYGMPVDQTALSASEGAAFGLFPIMWIVVSGDLDLQHDRRDRSFRRAAQVIRRDLQ